MRGCFGDIDLSDADVRPKNFGEVLGQQFGALSTSTANIQGEIQLTSILQFENIYFLFSTV